jgi:hypothetical protein
MAWSFVATASGSGFGSTVSLGLGAAVGAGDLIIAIAQVDNDTALDRFDFLDDNINPRVYSELHRDAFIGEGVYTHFYEASAAGTPTLTWHLNVGVTVTMSIAAYHSDAGFARLDQRTFNTATGLLGDSGDVTVALPDELLVSMASTRPNRVPIAGTGYTLRTPTGQKTNIQDDVSSKAAGAWNGDLDWGATPTSHYIDVNTFRERGADLPESVSLETELHRVTRRHDEKHG